VTKQERIGRAAADLAIAADLPGNPLQTEIEKVLASVQGLLKQCPCYENPAVTTIRAYLDLDRVQNRPKPPGHD